MTELADNPLQSGPLLGQVSGDTARIWVQAHDENALTLRLHRGGAEEVREFSVTPRQSEYFCAVFVLSELSPDASYEYAIHGARGVTPRYRLRAAPSAFARTLQLAFGSCVNDYWEIELPIFDAIARETPHAFLMLGDNCYFGENDLPSEQGMMAAHLRTRRHPSFARMCRETPTLAIYDDHDFGPNDADGNYEGRERALSAFTRMWAQALYGTEQVAGIFSSLRLGPVELFLTDGRYHRNVSGDTVLGRAQLEWLLDGLRRSTAPVKLIASGTTVLAHHPFYHNWESWHRTAPDDLEELLSTIEREDLHGVLFLSGDLHMGQVRHVKGREVGARIGPEFWEVTSSPLAIDPYNEHVLWPEGPLIAQVHDRRNYGLIDINLDRKDQEIALALKDEEGHLLFHQPIALSSLRVR